VSSHYTKTYLGELNRARDTGDMWSRDITSFSIVPPEPGRRMEDIKRAATADVGRRADEPYLSGDQ
jgi:hypothetical protein